MSVQIKLDQAPLAPGLPGQAREDFVLGTSVVATAVGGPFLGYQWSILDKPVDLYTNVQSGAFLSAPNASATQVQTVDVLGTYLLQLAVDSGSGIGANADDVATITFYAGPALNAVADQLPRRFPAFGERIEHNVPDPVFPSGNPRGWAQEMQRWLMTLASSVSGKFAAVRWNEGGGSIVSSSNVFSVTKTSTGVYVVQFINNAPNGDYIVLAGARGAVGGTATPNAEAVNSFVINRGDPFGSLVDADFSAVVFIP